MPVYDINDFKKNKHSKLKNIRKSLWLIFSLYVIIYFGIYYKEYSLQSLQRSLSYMTMIVSDENIQDNISIDIGRTTVYDIFQNGFVTLDKDMLTYINAASKIDTEIPYAYQNPDIVVFDNQIITFDRKGNDYSISNSYGEVYTSKISSPIIQIKPSEDGSYAVITDETSYISAITVFDKSNKEVFKWSTSSYNVVTASIDESAKKLVALCVYQKDTDVITKIIKFDVSNKEISNEQDIKNQIPIDTKILSNGNIIVILNNKIIMLDKDLHEIYSEDVINLRAYNIENSHNILYATDDDTGIKITILDKNGKVTSSKTVRYIVKGYALSNENIYLMTSTNVYKFDTELNLLDQIDVESNMMSIIYKERLYGVYNDRVVKLF